MGDASSPVPLPMPLRETLDLRCDAFEAAWLAGQTPEIEQFVAAIDPLGRAPLLLDLCVIEQHYRRTRGEPLSDEQFAALHPQLGQELQDVLTQIQQLHAPSDSERTLQSPQRSGPSPIDYDGLHVRCPHCSHPVEFVAHSPLDNITCRTCGSAFHLVDPEASGTAAPRTTIGRFALLERLGMGGFGTVWRANDPELDREVAVKIPRKGQLSGREAEQFIREARSAAQLRHPHIVPVYEVGREGDVIFIVSELVRGVPLGDWLENESPSVRKIVELTALVCDAVHHAHQQGVIHRDLKPANILVDQSGLPYVMDFGLAKREAGELTMTFDGQILGTPSYMSPEQAGGHSHTTDARTDVYSLGVTLFRFLTGELPYRGNAQTQMRLKLTDDAPDPRQLNRFVPRDLATLCVKCLERNPDRRISSAGFLRDELQRWLRGEPVRSRPISRLARLGRWARRRPALATAGALAAFLAVAGPLTALRLNVLLTERTHLVKRLDVEKSTVDAENARLSEALDQLKGEADPWRYWPLPNAPWAQRQLLAKIDEGRSAALNQALQTSKLDDRQRACAALALAMLADHRTPPDAAVALQYFQAATDPLQRILERRPNDDALRRTLSYCFQQRARLELPQDRAAAAEALEQASALLLSADSTFDQFGTTALLHEVDFDHMTLHGFATDSDPMLRFESRLNDFPKALGDDPIAVYKAICALLARESFIGHGDVAQ